MVVAIRIDLLYDVIIAGLHPHSQLLGIVTEIMLRCKFDEVLFDLLMGVNVAECTDGVRIDVSEDVRGVVEGCPVVV